MLKTVKLFKFYIYFSLLTDYISCLWSASTSQQWKSGPLPQRVHRYSYLHSFQAVDLCTLLKQQIAIPEERPLPYLIFITSVGLSASHEEIFVATISSILSGSCDGEQATTSLMIAAKQPVERYMAHLTSILHRSAGRHKISTFDLSESFLASPVTQSSEDLYNDLRKRVSRPS